MRKLIALAAPLLLLVLALAPIEARAGPLAAGDVYYEMLQNQDQQDIGQYDITGQYHAIAVAAIAEALDAMDHTVAIAGTHVDHLTLNATTETTIYNDHGFLKGNGAWTVRQSSQVVDDDYLVSDDARNGTSFRREMTISGFHLRL